MTVQMEAVAQPIVDAAVAETKAWLRIEMAQDDDALAAHCRSAIGMAEDFCAQHLIMRAGTERVGASREWRRLRAGPVRSIGMVRGLDAEGLPVALPEGSYALDINADGDGWLRVVAPHGVRRVEVTLLAGMADDWTDLSAPLRQGIVRLAAYFFTGDDNGVPPAVVTALWRPWRRMRLA